MLHRASVTASALLRPVGNRGPGVRSGTADRRRRRRPKRKKRNGNIKFVPKKGS